MFDSNFPVSVEKMLSMLGGVLGACDNPDLAKAPWLVEGPSSPWAARWMKQPGGRLVAQIIGLSNEEADANAEFVTVARTMLPIVAGLLRREIIGLQIHAAGEAGPVRDFSQRRLYELSCAFSEVWDQLRA